MKKTIEEIEKNQCTGCGLCAEKCPKGCILMIEDREGFRFPQIDSSKCIQCGICFSKCPTTSIAESLYSKYNRKYYCGIIKNKEILIDSSSGGIFGALAEYIINIGGYVCGCVYTDDLEAVHKLSNDKQDVKKMYGSKYVQSRAEHCFPEIQNLLSENEKTIQIFTVLRFYAMECLHPVCLESISVFLKKNLEER